MENVKYPIMLGSAILAGAMQTSCTKQPAEAPRPNILFILADDLGYGDLGCYGQQKFETPNIDALARDGMRFTQCYAGTTVSAPSRSCLLTGTHTGHTPIRGNIELPPEGQYPLPEGSAVLFRSLQDAGYRTGVFGKWGLGFIGSTGDPSVQGVDRFYGYNCQLLAHSYYPDHLWSDSERVELEDNTDAVPYGQGSYAPDLIHAEAIRFLDEQTPDRPFMLFYPTTIPHAELIVPEDSIIQQMRGRYEETPYRGCDSGPYFRRGGYCSQEYPHATFAAMVMRLDAYVGDLVAHLRERGLADNTLIIFASDNGPHMEGGADPDFFNSNGPLRGYKRDLYEGGIRVPMIAVWPGHIEAGSESDLPCAFWDLPATFAELSGTPTPCGDGLSIVPTLTGRADEQQQHDYFYFGFMELGGRQAVRQGDWKLVRLNLRSENPRTELYNLAEDLAEENDLAAQYPERVAELEKLLEEAYTADPAWPLFGEQ